MYYLIYIPLYLISLLPLRLLYLFGDGIYAILYYVAGYRKTVVMANLQTAFPEKTEAERKRIARKFYHHFVDSFIETIKFLSWNMKAVDKRWTADMSGMEEAYKSGKTIHILGMHNFNWEFTNWALAKGARYPFLGIYMPIGNKAFDRIIMKMRSAQGTVLLPATQFKTAFKPFAEKVHILGNVGDQSPGNPDKAYWLYFFGKPTAFVTGPEKGARINDAAVVFGHFYPTRRGHYHLDTRFVTSDPLSLPEGELTRRYVQFIEASIRSQPANYLWSHRRWKKAWKPQYLENWIDVKPPPSESSQPGVS